MEDNNSYRRLIGKLLYIAVNTGPDISAIVSILCQHNIGATKTDWDEAKRTDLYLKGTKELKPKLGDTKDSNKEFLIGYADTDWVENRSDRKSNSGYLFQSEEATISRALKKQDSFFNGGRIHCFCRSK
ncbi:secreted RxLR effector protein 161-like [Belonocnema kinseyi]|uniref:secreted RxLR effector protein 161-like n=1 Tax=Belonocnema kinseyi TaxID=2817044 RepID=UPI00143CECB6|nr:secreted RxLR effector protein 161-like [Belonocnema kinseyi]